MSFYRGRLIWPQMAELFPLDTEATAADPDGMGSATSGYHDIYREPILVPDTAGASVRRIEGAPIYLQCQVEVPKYDAGQALPQGVEPSAELRLVFHFAELEAAGLVHGDDGAAKVPIGTRLGGFYHLRTGALIQAVTASMFATRTEPRSFGLSGLTRNLLVVTFADRTRGEAGR